jgi:hypothetical protein
VRVDAGGCGTSWSETASDHAIWGAYNTSIHVHGIVTMRSNALQSMVARPPCSPHGRLCVSWIMRGSLSCSTPRSDADLFHPRLLS